MPKAAREARIRVGVVPQMDNLDPDFTVRENLLVYGGYFGLQRSVLEERIPRLLDFAGLASKRDVGIRTLSGGMKRRLTLARALVNDPDLLILDEPTTGLDPQARHLIWDGLRHLLSQGKTILLTTHFMDEAERLATRLAVIDHGMLIASDTPRALLARHVEPEVIEVYGDEVKAWADIHGRRLAQRLELAGETAFCYAKDAQPMLNDLATRAGVRYLHRPANLEDLFIKLTGRELRDVAPMTTRARLLRTAARVGALPSRCGGATCSSGASSRSRACSATSRTRCCTCSRSGTASARSSATSAA